MTVVRRAETESEREEALVVRHEVFVEDQGVPEELETDGRDEATHFAAYDRSGESVADDAEPEDSDSGSDSNSSSDFLSDSNSEYQVIGTV